MGIQPRLGFTILAVIALLATAWYFIGTRGDNYGSDEPVGAAVERLRSFFDGFRPDRAESAEAPGPVPTSTPTESVPAGVGAVTPHSPHMTTGEALAIPDWVSGGVSPDDGASASPPVEAEPTVAMPTVPESARSAPPPPPEAEPERRSVFDRQRSSALGDEAMWDDHR